MGADAWGSAELMELCGKDCIGQYFSTHYAAAGAKGKTKEFIDEYKAKYDYVPDDVAALTWDAVNLVLQAIQSAPTYSTDPVKEREIIRDSLSKISSFEGITGSMSFDDQGDPIKCAVIVRISEDGQFVFTESVCPDK
jgi:branched-chain amino acid transport system substrate-binding protein